MGLLVDGQWHDRWYDTASETVHYDHIKRHYYESHRGINPTGVVPLGPLQPY